MDHLFSELEKVNADIDKILKVPLSNKINLDADINKGIIWDLLKYSNEVSLSLRTVLKDNLIRPASAIIRIRLEQTIVSSYLIHAPEEEGLRPFLLQSGITLYKIYQKTASSCNETFYNKLLKSVGIDINVLKNNADLAQEEKKPDSGKYDREWTKLNLYELSKRRDELNKDVSVFSNIQLSNLYSLLYKSGSSLIHSDILICASSFNDELSTFNSRNLIINNILFDLLQVYELTNYLGYSFLSELEEIYDKYGSIGLKCYPFMSTKFC